MNSSTAIPIGLIVLLVIITCCLCVCVAAAGIGLLSYFSTEPLPWDLPDPLTEPSSTPMVVRPTITQPPAAQAPTATSNPFANEIPVPAITPTPVIAVVPTDTLRTLEEVVIPVADLRDLAYRLKGVENIPVTMEPPAAPLRAGEKKAFWATNVDTNESFQVNAVLRFVTDHLYFWIEEGLRYDERDLRDLALTFENEIYPTTRAFFGSEWNPGVDGDPHLYILFVGNLGSSVAGYFSSSDSYHPLAHPYSNGHETFFVNADHTTLDSMYLRSVLAHEFQHMIHWYGDRNETSWLNEGFSELSVLLNGYDTGAFDYIYSTAPDIQLNDWPNDSSMTVPHYGASFLFVTYFLDRFGEEATKLVVAEDENGLPSFDKVLEAIEAVDPVTGQPIRADDVFQDWTITSYLQDQRVGDGRYIYNIYPGAPQPGPTETIRTCPSRQQTRDVRQYGVDYIRILCKGDYTLHFEGSTMVRVVPADPISGSYAFWSNKGDESNMTLTRSFDFTNHSGPLTLSFRTWYDLEADYDYLYLLASEDGEQWQIITTPSGTGQDLSGNSYGWGYNGLSARGPHWILEEVDLSQFAGKQVFLRFEYVTDAAVNGEGFLLDDVSILETGYFTDFEDDDGGWQGEGFVRIENILPQTFRLALILKGSTTTVQYIELADTVDVDIPFSISGDVTEAVLVVSGSTRFTREPAAYRFSITP